MMYFNNKSTYFKCFAFGIPAITSAGAASIWYEKRGENKKIYDQFIKVPVNKSLFKSTGTWFKYNDFIFPDAILTPKNIRKLKEFVFKDDDIIVASFPKTGTTWVQEIVYMLTHNCQPSSASSDLLETRFPYLEYLYPGIDSIMKEKGQRFIKTHLPASLLPQSFFSSKAKLIYIARNPRDTAVSYYHFMKLLSFVNFIGTFEEFVELFISDCVPYAPFYEHIRGYDVKKNSENILFIYYEDLKENPEKLIKKIAEFLKNGSKVNDDDIAKVAAATTFVAMANNTSVNYEHWKGVGMANKDQGYFLRKGTVGDWKNYFSPDLLTKFQAWEDKNNKENGHNFIYELD